MTKETVLFLCSGNSCRSQMAEGFLRKFSGDVFNVQSAGLAPKPIHAYTIKAMIERGIDISTQRSKSISEFMGKVPVHYAIFVCEQAEKDCPRIYPFALSSLSWHLDDPTSFIGTEAQQYAKFCEIRDQIEAKILDWLKTLRQTKRQTN